MTLKRAAKPAFTLVSRGVHRFTGISRQSNCARSWRRQRVAVGCWRKETGGRLAVHGANCFGFYHLFQRMQCCRLSMEPLCGDAGLSR